uniref:Glycoprotein I n=1 Tax=Macrostomum lignano TaxID=282301 RepID=A0A1I8F3S9_9PLAT
SSGWAAPVVPGEHRFKQQHFLESNGSYDGAPADAFLSPAARGSIFDSLDRLNSTLVDADCPFTGNTLHTKVFPTGTLSPIIVIASLVAFCEVIGVVIACCLIRDINSKRLVV